LVSELPRHRRQRHRAHEKSRQRRRRGRIPAVPRARPRTSRRLLASIAQWFSDQPQRAPVRTVGRLQRYFDDGLRGTTEKPEHGPATDPCKIFAIDLFDLIPDLDTGPAGRGVREGGQDEISTFQVVHIDSRPPAMITWLRVL